MAEVLDLIMTSPAAWGVAGAVIYSAPRWLACQFGAERHSVRCTLEGLCSLAVGAIAAAAFAPWLQRFLHQQPSDLNAISAMIGLLANPTAPKLVDRLSGAVAGLIADRATKQIKEADHEP